MKTIRIILGLILALSLVSCERLYYPNSLNGIVQNGTYTTKVGRGEISCRYRVINPHAYSEYEVHWICTKEFYGKGYTYTSFGPIASDDTIFRIMIVKKPAMPLRTFRLIYFPTMIDIAARGYGRHMFKIHEEDILLGGNPAIYEVYTQEIPSVYYYISRFQPNDKILTHMVYFVDFCDYYIIFWIQASNQSAINAVNNRNRWKVVNRTWKPANRFLRSFVLVK